MKALLTSNLIFGALLVSCNSNAPSELKHVGGSNELARKFPSSVSIYPLDENGSADGVLCTSTKIGPREFLTAGHCLMIPTINASLRIEDKVEPQPFLSIGAKLDLVTVEGSIVPVTVAKLSVHPIYHHGWYAASKQGPDIAILHVNEETPAIPIAKIGDSDVKKGDKIYLGGGGCENIEPEKSLPPIKYSEGKVTDVENFIKNAKRAALDNNKNALEFAARGQLISQGRYLDKKTGDLCNGDSGGGVYIERKGSFEVIGVNSWSDVAAKGNAFNIFGKLDNLRVPTFS